MAEQTEIPGTERPKIRRIEDAAKNYEKVRNQRMEATEAEVKAKDRLQNALHDMEDQLVDRDDEGNPLYIYVDGDGEKKEAVLMRSEESVKVRKHKPAKDAAAKADAGSQADA